VWLIVVFINGLMNWLWSRWSVPTIGNGDLEFFLSYGLMWGLTAMAHWLLLATSLALIINRRTTQLAFIPYLLISALFWWLMVS
ncbi:MAG: prepilin peptidase, partial [Levilactobacillus brevis]